MDYREILKAEFNQRRKTDPFYSLRSFAKDLDVTHQHLSLILKGKRGLSKLKAEFIATHLGFKTHAIRRFGFLVASQSGRSIVERNLAIQGLKRYKDKEFWQKAETELTRNMK